MIKSTLGGRRGLSSGQWLIGDGEQLFALGVIYGPDAENGAQLIGRNDQWRRRGCRAGRRLRESRRPSRMEGYLALDLLHQLMNMTVEHSHRTETLEQG